MGLDCALVHKQAKQQLGQYPAILTAHLVNKSCIISDQQTAMFFPMSDEPPSIIQWLYQYLNGQQVS